MTRSSSVASGSDPAPAVAARRPRLTGTRDRAPGTVRATGLAGWWARNTREMQWTHWAVDIVIALFIEVVLGWPFVMLASSRVYFEPLLVLPWVLFTLALVLRRRSPVIALWLCVAAVLFKAVTGGEPHGQDIAIAVVLYSAAAYGGTCLRIVSVVLCGVFPAVLVTLMALRPMRSIVVSAYPGLIEGSVLVGVVLSIVVWTGMTFLLTMCWFSGQVRRSLRRAEEAAHRREVAELESLRSREQLYVEQERNRIARDMHDVVAHSLAVVVAQADGGRYAMRANPQAGEESLTTIAETAREALVEVRGLLAQLRHSQPEGPQRGFADVPAVLERMRAAGLPIAVESQGVPRPLGRAVDNALFRLVQESLTNSLRHGDRRSPTVIGIAWGDELHVRVENVVNPVPPPPRADSGHGLIGMRERIVTAGGRLEVGRQGDRFVVYAVVPTGGAASPGAPATAPQAVASDGGARADYAG